MSIQSYQTVNVLKIIFHKKKESNKSLFVWDFDGAHHG